MLSGCKISVTDFGVTIHVPAIHRWFRKNLPESIECISWSEVTGVVMFKLDNWSVDMICMAFETNGTITLQANEEMMGWKELVTAVPVHLPGAMSQEEWFQKVAYPMFRLCWTRIYPREAQEPGHTPA